MKTMKIMISAVMESSDAAINLYDYLDEREVYGLSIMDAGTVVAVVSCRSASHSAAVFSEFLIDR